MSESLLEGEKVAKHTIKRLLLMGALKILAGLASGMTVIFADAINTFAGILSVFGAYFGLRLSRRTANKKFEYGYYKIETFMALLISIVITFLGYLAIKKGIGTLTTSEGGQFRSFAITTTVLSIVQSLRIQGKLREMGKKINSLSLITSANEKKMEVATGFAVLASIIANYQQVPYVEGIITIIISIFVLKVGLFSMKDSLFFLLDYWDDPVLKRKIKTIFRREKDLVLGVKKMRLRRAGTFIFGEAFIEISPFAGIQDLRAELNILESKILGLSPYIKDFSIYTNIGKTDKAKIAFPISKGKDLEGTLAPSLQQTKAYLFANVHEGKVSKFYIKEIAAKQKKTIELANFLKKEDVNIVIDNKLNSLVYYNLRRTHHILIYPCFADVKTVNNILKLLLIDT